MIISTCSSDTDEQLWVWEYTTEDGKQDMFMDLDEDIRFKVFEEVFVDTLPTNSEMYNSFVCVHMGG